MLGRGFRLWVVLVGCFAATCSSTAVRRPAWYPPRPCRRCYQGVGVAADYPTAKKRALASLCDDIAVVVSSSSTDERARLLRGHSDAAGGTTERIDFRELTRVVNRTRSRCYFKGMPIKETQEEIDGRSYVLLSMSIADYSTYMARRTAFVWVRAGNTPDARKALAAAVEEHLRRSGYLVTGSEDTAHYLAVLEFEATLSKSPADFQGLIVGSATVDYVLERKRGALQVESLHIDDLTARGFSTENVVRKLAREAVGHLARKWQMTTGK